MKKAASCSQERRHFGAWWLKGTAIVLLLGLVLGCAPSTPPTPTKQFVASATPTKPSPTQSAPAPTPAASPTPIAVPEELPSKGSPEAKVFIIEFSEFLCPWCARFATETAREVEKEYVTTGLVQIIFIDFIVHGEPALLAAEAAH